MDQDNNRIAAQLFSVFLVKSILLIILIIHTSIVVGSGFFISSYLICEIIEWVSGGYQFEGHLATYKQLGVFESEGEKYITKIYYAFTTLSTVGFGDYHPQNSAE